MLNAMNDFQQICVAAKGDKKNALNFDWAARRKQDMNIFFVNGSSQRTEAVTKYTQALDSQKSINELDGNAFYFLTIVAGSDGVRIIENVLVGKEHQWINI